MKKLAIYPEFAKDYFEILGKDLFRRLANGNLKKITLIDRTRLVLNFAGEIYTALEIAYILHYGYFPKRTIITINGDPFDLSLHNVAALRGKKYRCCVRQFNGYFMHGLSKTQFTTNAAAYQDWCSVTQHIYRSEMPLVLKEDAFERQLLLENIGRPRPSDFPAYYMVKTRRRAIKPPRPSKEHVWSGKEWVIVPKAINVADDYKVRAQRVLEGYTKFKYDENLQQVVVAG